jgi:hypothetical protein
MFLLGERPLAMSGREIVLNRFAVVLGRRFALWRFYQRTNISAFASIDNESFRVYS